MFLTSLANLSAQELDSIPAENEEARCRLAAKEKTFSASVLGKVDNEFQSFECTNKQIPSICERHTNIVGFFRDSAENGTFKVATLRTQDEY